MIDVIKLIENDSKEFNYRLLSRLKSDCDYYLRNPHEKHLWAGNVEDQIDKMRELYNSFADSEKPEWISLDDIQNYEDIMISVKYSNI